MPSTLFKVFHEPVGDHLDHVGSHHDRGRELSAVAGGFPSLDVGRRP
jgi:hypothetical protein